MSRVKGIASGQHCAVAVAGEQLVLLPQRAVYWPRQRTLFIADTHFGKAATFRSAAVPVPDCTAADLRRLDEALSQTRARQLIVLGDLIHARAGRSEYTFATIETWRGKWRQLEIVLVRGNHDRSAGDPPGSWQMQCLDGPQPLGPFCLRHEPCDTPPADRHELYTLAGHRHPKVKLTGAGRAEARLPCFLFGRSQAILPAFSEFVDSALLRPAAEDRVFVVAGEEVLEV